MDTVQETQAYYEGGVELIYRRISGTTLHLGIFDGVDDTREAAYARTKAFLVSRLPPITSDTTIIDLGCGYGDMGRHLAHRFGCRVIGLNLIHNQNVTSTALTAAAGQRERVSTVEADFARVPFPSGCTTVVWSQEAMLHAPDRAQVVKEASRLLQPGGTFLFTDILQVGPLEAEEARLIFERVKIDSLESFESYTSNLIAAGLEIVDITDLSSHVGRYYGERTKAMHQQRKALSQQAPAAFVDYTIEATARWAKAGDEGKLGWGVFVARKPVLPQTTKATVS